MENQATKSNSHAVFALRLHIVFVTKYRRKIFTVEILNYLNTTFAEILDKWRCKLVEFGGEEDHVHLLIEIHPALNISTLINNLKTASSRRLGRRFAEHIARFYWEPALWHRAYFVGSVGMVSLDTIRRYIEAQYIKEASPHPA